MIKADDGDGHTTDTTVEIVTAAPPTTSPTTAPTTPAPATTAPTTAPTATSPVPGSKRYSHTFSF